MASKDLNSKLKNIYYSDSEYSSHGDSSDDEGNAVNDLNLTLDKLNLGPKKKLLVLSIGGLLVHRGHNRERMPNARRHDFVCGNFRIWKSSYCDEFLKFCFERFEVGIWSSAMEHNVDSLLYTVMGDLRKKIVFAWDQEETTDSGFRCLDNRKKPIFLKELKKIWEKKSFGGKYSSSNTLLIDDEPYKALLNPANTAIFPEKYRPDKNAEDKFLSPKGEFQVYLDGLADADSVTGYVKENPFGQPAISPAHSDYDYYEKIIQKFD